MRTTACLFPSPVQMALSVVFLSESAAKEPEEEQRFLAKLLHFILFSIMEEEGLHRSQGIQQKLTGVQVLIPQEA